MSIKRKKIVRHENPGIKAAIERVEGHSQSALARLLGVTQPAVVHWLRVRCPPEQAMRIEAILGVDKALICPEIFA